jgi:4-hydroxy-3-methylbut-2-enyl diphosphate reductase
MSAASQSPPSLVCILAFNGSNQLAVRRLGSKAGLPFTGTDLTMATARLKGAFNSHTPPAEYFSADANGRTYRVFFVQVHGTACDREIVFYSIESLQAQSAMLGPSLGVLLDRLEPHLNGIPYLHLGENDFINKFRPEKERNTAIYTQDPAASALYQSQLCAVIKTHARHHERSATAPVRLDFGPVNYLIPSHFGFCLGVKNAIESAYETLTENPGRRVFMLSELIHNPFVNEDLHRRGLRYLQTDKGIPSTVDGTPGSPELWDTLTADDIVIIPAFGATDEDKARLVRKGIAVSQHDATCMLVEKVWKAARSYGREGYTVIIHGKAEHEETKATFSNTRRYAPALIVRDLDETKRLCDIIRSNDPAERAGFPTLFAGKFTPGFDVDRHLERIAVVNQTTLLMNETRAIIALLREVYMTRFGESGASRVGGSGRSDTLCYATQVNQDALSRALAEPLDAAFVIGGKNSSNTFQLYRLCEQSLGDRAYFIQSEANILSRDTVQHYVFPSLQADRPQGHIVERKLWSVGSRGPLRALITGGASCPDGIIQQVIARINGLFPAPSLRSMGDVLAALATDPAAPSA